MFPQVLKNPSNGFDMALSLIIVQCRGCKFSCINDLSKDRLKVFKVRSPILIISLLVLGVSFNSTSDSIHESFGVIKVLLKESLGVIRVLPKESIKLDPRQGNFGLALTLVLVSARTDPTLNERSCKRGTVNASGAGSLEMILTLLVGLVTFHVGFSEIKVREPGFQRTLSGTFLMPFSLALTLKELLYSELCDPLKIFLDVPGKSRGGGWSRSACIAWCWSSFCPRVPLTCCVQLSQL